MFVGAAAAVLVVALVATIRSTKDPASTDVPPTTVTASLPTPFEGKWVIDDIGAGQEMDVRLADGEYTVVVRDLGGDACLGPFVTTRTGSINSSGALVLGEATLACEEGGSPTAASRPAAVTLIYDGAADKITDSTGLAWRRSGSAVWPQSSPTEVLDAQRRADAGDPTAAWQVDPRLDSGSANEPPDFTQVEIFSRYLRDELGWEEFRTAEAFGGRGMPEDWMASGPRWISSDAPPAPRTPSISMTPRAAIVRRRATSRTATSTSPSPCASRSTPGLPAYGW